MASIQDKIKACDYVLANMLDEQERIIYANENKIIRLQTSQFESGMGNDGKSLFNSNKRYSGRYTYFTQQVALFEHPVAPKIEGELYNFAWSGDFLRGLEVEVLPNLSEINIFSTGTGSGKKSLFFAGYTNLFGLDKENQRILNMEIILPDLQKWIKSKIE